MNKTLGSFLVLAAILIAAPAQAGWKITQPVTVGSFWAYGALGSARNSADAVQYIGCYHAWSLAGCYAQTAAGEYRSCFTTDSRLVTLVASLKGDSQLYFEWDLNGNCSIMYVYDNSYYEPKQP